MSVRFYDKLYVGVQNKKSFNTENPPLAFATQVGTDKAWEKRKKTVDDWAGYSNRGSYQWNEETRKSEYVPPAPQTEEGFYIDNEFVAGFYFEKSVTRWETSNKWFAINDPRGFQLQISAENLGDILLNSHISKGMLVGKFKWAKNGANIFLCREDHPDYLAHKNPVIPKEKVKVTLAPGDRVVMPYAGTRDRPVTYIGKKYVLGIQTHRLFRNRETGVISSTHPQSHYYWGQSVNPNITHDMVHEISYKKFDGNYHAFAQNEQTYKNVYLQRSIGIIEVVDREAKIPDFATTTDLQEIGMTTYSAYSSKAKLFNSKKELESCVPTVEELRAEYMAIEQLTSAWSQEHYGRYGINVTDEVVNVYESTD